MAIMKVVKEGMCSYKEIKDGDIDFEDIINMIDYLELKQDLEKEAYDKAKQKAKEEWKTPLFCGII